MGAEDQADQGLEAVLLAATRSAAAGRFAAPAAPTPQTRICAAMPELLAARANGELRGDGHAVTQHLAQCTACTASEARLRDAEAAFSTSPGWLAGEAADPA
jgi:hypothetical protein